MVPTLYAGDDAHIAVAVKLEGGLPFIHFRRSASLPIATSTQETIMPKKTSPKGPQDSPKPAAKESVPDSKKKLTPKSGRAKK